MAESQDDQAPTTNITHLERAYSAFVRQLEEAKVLFNQARQYSAHEKARQAVAILNQAVLDLAGTPGLLEMQTFNDPVSGQSSTVEVLCFKPLIVARDEGNVVLCLFRDGLYWVPIKNRNYAFLEREPITSVETLFRFDDLGKAVYARILELLEY